MDVSRGIDGLEERIAALFEAVFTAAEGAEEGAAVGGLVRRLLDDTSPEDLAVFTAWQDGALVGSVVFSRLRFAGDARRVMLLSPMAVATEAQGRGVGQALLTRALAALAADGAEVAITYGDPAFYGRVGFTPLAEADAPPPQPLSQPEGWIGRSLTDAPLTPLRGPSRCVAALDDPAIW